MTYALSLPLNRSHVMEQLERLLRIYKRPQHAPADATEFATDYAQICGELTSEQFTGSVDAYLKGAGKWFPKPGELLAIGRGIARAPGSTGSLEGQYLEWERNGWKDPITGKWAPCPVCQEYLGLHTVRINADGTTVDRYLVLHNGVLHATVHIPFTGRAKPGTGVGHYERYELRVIDARPAPALLADPAEGA